METRQYQFCEICRRNQRDGERHVFAKSHKKKVDILINKFSSKVNLVQVALTTQPIATNAARDEKFWCHFCGDEYRKHYLLDDCAGKGGGVAQHFSSAAHKRQSQIFSRLHRIGAEQMEKFTVEDSIFSDYVTKLATARLNYFSRIQEKLDQEASRIAEAEVENAQIAASGQRRRYQEIAQCSSAPPGQGAASARGRGTVGGLALRTIEAKGDGLTCIRIPDEEDGEGNVYTSDTLPPWLRQEATAATSSGVIGPTMDDYEKHKRSERRSKLPAARVGADFSPDQATGSDWRPAFGHVWSKHRSSQKTRGSHAMGRRQEPQRTATLPAAPLPPLKRMKFGEQ